MKGLKMKKAILAVSILAIMVLITAPALGSKYQVQTYNSYKINGVELEPGRYQIKIHPTESSAWIMDRGQPITQVNIEISEVESEERNTVLVDSERNLLEYRSPSRTIVFLD